MKVQQVGLDGKRICAKGRPIAHVGHRIKTLCTYTRACDIDAILRHKFFVAPRLIVGTVYFEP